MMIDSQFVFGLPAISNSNTATVSTNYYDALTAKIIFGTPKGVRVYGRQAVSVDTTGYRVDFVGADDTALSSAVHVLGSTGILGFDELGVALAAGTQNVQWQFMVRNQTIAKRYYGLLLTLSGTNPDATANATSGVIALDVQTDMPFARAAVPA